MSARTIAITQPTFLGWAGWYDLIDQVDLVILLDDVSFAKRSWQQRNRLRTPQGLSYVTVPVLSAGRRSQLILDTDLVDDDFVDTLIRTVSTNYARAPHFSHYFPEFSAVLKSSAESGKLLALNCGLIDWLAAQLGVKTPRLRSSELGVEGKRGARLANLCAHVGATRYVSPVGAEGYLIEDRAEFESRCIAVALHCYDHPVYRQCFQPFIPYASVLDLLFNEGDSALEILRSGRRAPRALGH